MTTAAGVFMERDAVVVGGSRCIGHLSDVVGQWGAWREFTEFTPTPQGVREGWLQLMPGMSVQAPELGAGVSGRLMSFLLGRQTLLHGDICKRYALIAIYSDGNLELTLSTLLGQSGGVMVSMADHNVPATLELHDLHQTFLETIATKTVNAVKQRRCYVSCRKGKTKKRTGQEPTSTSNRPKKEVTSSFFQYPTAAGPDAPPAAPPPVVLAPASALPEPAAPADSASQTDWHVSKLAEAAIFGYMVLDASTLLEQNKDHWWDNYSRYRGKLSVFDSVSADGRPQPHAGDVYMHPVTKERLHKPEFRFLGPDPNASVPWAWVISTMLVEFIRPFGFLTDPSGAQKPWDLCVKMTSLPHGPWQPPHADSAPRDSLQGMDCKKLPWAVLFATEDGTLLKIWKPGAQEPIILTLSKGELLIMRGDLGHSGASYTVENSRIHLYIDSMWVSDQGLQTSEPIARRGKKEDRDTFLFRPAAVGLALD